MRVYRDGCVSVVLNYERMQRSTGLTAKGSTHPPTAVSETLAVTLDLAAPQEPGQIAGRVA